MNKATYCIGILLILLSATLKSQSPNSWTQIASFPGPARAGAVGFSIDSFGYVSLGFSQGDTFPNPYRYYNDLWRYDPHTNAWIQMAGFPGLGRQSAICFVIGSKAYIGLGGGGNNSVTYADFWEYDPVADSWSRKADFGGRDRGEAIAFSLNGKGYAGLGLSDTASSYPNDIWEYDPSTDTWTQKADFSGGGRLEAIGLNIGAYGYVGLGYNNFVNNGRYSNDFWQYDPVTDSWSQKSNFPDSIVLPFVLTIGDRGYVGCGINDVYQYEKGVWEYNPYVDSWSLKDSFSGGIRVGGTAFTLGTKGYAGVGTPDYLDNCVSDFWMYTPDSLPTGIHTIDANTITLSPNPATDKLYINTSLADYTIYITDMTGRSWPAAFTDREIDVSALPAGIYCLRLQNSDGMVVRKFVKE